ncbi:hypothetical protein GTY67_13200 [Streptomyces sp. SID8374]|uniref:hypothetical protein n=1 Tax=Streptomyces sp. SID8374 TaxID=2690354 RepID=UPI00136D737D|nr:hypothetical protein [Streptomyces sp. SID8374]MYX14353.1 hypothetical protein [Streptomyces sp. SID8374]
MTRYQVDVQTVAYATVVVEVPDGVTDPYSIATAALEGGAELPTLDAKGSGVGESWTLALEADGWTEVVRDGTPVVQRVTATTEQ